MAMLSFGGIDVSKDRLDVMVLPRGLSFTVGNDAAGCTELVRRLRGLRIAAIGVEASGGYERGVVRALLAAGLPVRQINPFKLRHFAKASGVLAKNDRLDARMIAMFVAAMPTRPLQRNKTTELLAEILAARRQLTEAKVAAANASRLFEDAMLQRLYSRRIAQLAADIAQLDERLAEIVAGDVALAHRYRLLTSMPGVGPLLACTLVTLLPELGHISRTQVAALVGVAPTTSTAANSKECAASGAAVHRSATCSIWRR
jgi:transposase